MGYKFVIEYKKGSANRAVDALSRRDESSVAVAGSTSEEGPVTDEDAGQTGVLLAAAAHPVPQLIELLKSENRSSPEMREIVRDISEGRAPPHLSLVEGLVWEDVSMDFITGLPLSRGYTTIMVVVDRLSKYAHFAPLPNRFDALKVAHLFINKVVRHHGFPKTLVSDRDSVFLNKVWEELMRLSGTKLNFSTAYHPQSDGQTKVRNRGLEQYLRAFTADRPSKWANFLPWAELALNCFNHAGLGMSPFKALYRREPPSLIFAKPSDATPPLVAELITQRGELLVELRRNLERAQQRMRDSANKHRRQLKFKMGDKAFVEGEVIGDTITLPSEFFGDRPVVYPIRVLDRRVLWHAGEPRDHVLVRWSDSTESPTWEPLQLIQRQFPNVLLEDKDFVIGGGVDTVPIQPATSAPIQSLPPTGVTEGPEQEAEEVPEVRQLEEPSIAKSKPRRNVRPPDKFGDYVTK
ncbi:uncharacterized protein LOC121759095 [Salvia splendens]|uniref:uncharacterized protein LOC121759095 n=1 Tax=Salvia splendens TaxID=180675 RepID=UPI001C26CF9E|nr:uncharacterized protein LOC121759095 [Salvia splendens]